MNPLLYAMALVGGLGPIGVGAQVLSADLSSESRMAVTAAPCVDGVCAQVKHRDPQVGDATRNLLQRQAQGDSASAQQYALSGVVAQKVYERYVNSFKHPIPEHSSSAIAKVGQGSK